MPNYKKHLAGAVLFYAVTLLFLTRYLIFSSVNLHSNYFSIMSMGQWFLFTLGGALFPDVDINSKGRNVFYKVFLCLFTLSFAFKIYDIAMLLVILFSLSILVKHRGLFHNLWFLLGIIVVTCGLLVQLLPDYKYLIISDSFFFSIGILSHLWLDLGFKKMLGFR